MELSRTWYYVNDPWKRFIGALFGKFVLINYYDLPNNNPNQCPPSYRFILLDHNNNITSVDELNVLNLEKWCEKNSH